REFDALALQRPRQRRAQPRARAHDQRRAKSHRHAVLQYLHNAIAGASVKRHNNPKPGETMRAAFYEKNGAARDVLSVAEVDTPMPGPGEVRVKLATSGVNPSDVKAREGRTRKLAYP